MSGFITNYVVLLAAIITFLLTLFKERSIRKKELRPILKVTQIDSVYEIYKDAAYSPGIQVKDKHDIKFEKLAGQYGDSFRMSFLVIENASENPALDLYVETKNGKYEDVWSKKFAFETLLPKEHILIPLGTPEHPWFLDDICQKIIYRTIEGEKLSYESKRVYEVKLDQDRERSKMETALYKYWFMFIKIRYLKFHESDYYTYFINK